MRACNPSITQILSLPLVLLAVAMVCLASASPSPAADAAPRLTGIAIVNGRNQALLELPAPRQGPPVRVRMFEGERMEFVEVRTIDAKAGTVSIQHSNSALVLRLPTPPAGQAPVLNLKDADSRALLDLHQELTGRTVLQSPTLPSSKLTLQTDGATSQAAAADHLVGALRERGVFLQPRTGRFTFATEFSKVARLAGIKEPPAPLPAEDKKSERFPPGLIKFSEADRNQVLDIYQELSRRTLLQGPGVPSAKVSLKSQTELSREEAIWMLEAALYLGGISVVPEGKQFAFILPGNRYATAPKVPDNPDEERLKKKPFLPAGALKLTGNTDSRELLKIYAELVGRTPLLDPAPPVARFQLRNQTSLHAVEAAYALDALAALHHLRFVPVGDKQVKLVRIPEPAPAATPAATK